MTRDKTSFQKDVEAQSTLCDERVRSWTSNLKEAQQQLEYWTLQQDALRVVSTRLIMEG